MAEKTLVLLGIGHTNAHIIKQWVNDPIDGVRLICVSLFPRATYSGMLPGTLGWQFSSDEMRIDLEALAEEAGAELILASASGLDLDAGELLFDDHDPVPFDAISIGVGSMPIDWQTHCCIDQFVPIKPMQTFQSRLEQRLPQRTETPGAKTPRIAIVGGGVASVEIALCLQQQLARRNRLPCEIDIFTTSERIADGMSPRSVRKIQRLLKRRAIGVFASRRVTEVRDHEIITNDSHSHSTDVVIWATGASPPPAIDSFQLQSDERGFIATSPTLQSLSDPRVFAVGDCGTILESPSPKAGVYAVRQCPVLWHNLGAFLRGESMRQFSPQRDFLKLLNTGDGKALLEYRFLSIHAAWCWRLKTWIDKRFVAAFRSPQPATIPTRRPRRLRQLPQPRCLR